MNTCDKCGDTGIMILMQMPQGYGYVPYNRTDISSKGAIYQSCDCPKSKPMAIEKEIQTNE